MISMSLSAINTAYKVVESHFYFEQQKTSGGKVLISINSDEKCKMLHHINFSDKLLRMLGLASAISSKHNFIPSSRYVNLIRMKQKRKFFLRI